MPTEGETEQDGVCIQNELDGKQWLADFSFFFFYCPWATSMAVNKKKEATARTNVKGKNASDVDLLQKVLVCRVNDGSRKSTSTLCQAARLQRQSQKLSPLGQNG